MKPCIACNTWGWSIDIKEVTAPSTTPTTTPANNGSQPDDVEAYNAIADEIMRRHGITVNDLNAFVVTNRIAQTEPRNCHFPRNSAERLGHQVATTLIGHITPGSSGLPSPLSPR